MKQAESRRERGRRRCKQVFARSGSSVAFLGRAGPTQRVGASLWPRPAALHTSRGRTITACLEQAETSIIRAEAETTAQNTKETRNADAGGAWLCCRFPPLILSLDGCTWGDTGLCTCLHVCLRNIPGVYVQPTNSFCFTLKGDFPVAAGFGKSN